MYVSLLHFGDSVSKGDYPQTEIAPFCFTGTFAILKSGLSPLMGKRKGNYIFRSVLMYPKKEGAISVCS